MKNKKIIISTVAIILLICAILGVLYFKTDLFKTDQQLFYKYIGQIEMMDSNFIKQYDNANKKITKNTNSSNMNIDFELMGQNLEPSSVESQKLLNIKSNGLQNSLTGQSYRDFMFSNNEENFLTLKYLKDGNVYGLFADNIVSKYLAVENSNLKDLFAKLGVEDVSQIPDLIPTNYEEILKIDEEILKQLKETYGILLYNNISKEKFYKVKNQDKTEIIGVSLTEQETIDVLKLMLDTIKNDNVILNLIVNKAQLLNYNNVTIELLQTKIQNIIDEMINTSYSTNDNFLNISLIKQGKLIKKINIETNIGNTIDNFEQSSDNALTQPITDVIKQNIEIDFSQANKINLSLKENDIELFKMIVGYLYDANNINLNIETQFNENETINVVKLQYKISNYQTDNIIQELTVNMNNGTEESYQVNLNNNITIKQDVQISKLTTDNSAKLNDMSSEELQQLVMALGNRINQIYGGSLTSSYTYNNGNIN